MFLETRSNQNFKKFYSNQGFQGRYSRGESLEEGRYSSSYNSGSGYSGGGSKFPLGGDRAGGGYNRNGGKNRSGNFSPRERLAQNFPQIVSDERSFSEGEYTSSRSRGFDSRGGKVRKGNNKNSFFGNEGSDFDRYGDRGGDRGGGRRYSNSSFGRSGHYERSRFGQGMERGRFGRQGRRFQAKQIRWEKYVQKATPKTLEEYQPKNTFIDFNLNPQLLSCIQKRGYLSPTPIQDKIIGAVMENQDVLGLADTGTGKTGAFLIPLLHNILEDKIQKKWTQYLVVAPTRELAIQIEQELIKLTEKEMWVFSTSCIGGTSMEKQIHRLKKHNHFIIGTPGRIRDLIESGHLVLKTCRGVVLDEVDRMLDMGFLEDISYIVESVPEPKQVLFFSATMDDEVLPTANTFLKTPFKVSIQSQTSSQNVEQNIVKYRGEEEKFDKLKETLNSVGKSLIFVKTKMNTEDLARDLRRAGIKAESIHGDKRLRERQAALRDFKEGRTKVLVATDVAARGIDISDIEYVINFDEPDNYDTYIHRIGRTGRAGKTGYALTFIAD